MKNCILIVLLLVLFQSSCRKNNDADVSGTVTINNNLTFDQQRQTYISYGFLFSKAKQVSILDTPPPDIMTFSDGTNISFEANNLKNSFFKYGEYASEASARDAFNNLTSANISQWEGSATPLQPNQIWIYRSGTEHYAKIRIISTFSETRGTFEYAECRFEWVYQPDGSLTFPGK
jgi:hypothetical protein